MRVVHINVTATLSTGRIAVGISQALMARGHKALIVFSRGYPPTGVPWIRVGNRADVLAHAALARITDRAGFFSRLATRKLVRQLRAYQPDVVHLHNLHGYYLHLPTLFQYLKEENLPVVWTLHDCWAYTGHCAYYTMAAGEASRRAGRTHRSATSHGCDRWQSGCGKCSQTRTYPQSLLLDQSRRNWQEKRALISALADVTLITPSRWLKNEVQQSFLKKFPVFCIPNGIDLNKFHLCDDLDYLEDVLRKHHLEDLGERKLLLSVASTWDKRKGLADFVALSDMLPPEYLIVLVGLSAWQRERVPRHIWAIERTENLRELCALYTAADLYISLSREETMGMTLLEAMACGTQVLCYRATALPESVTPAVGAVVPLGNLQAVAAEVERLCASPKSAADCRARAEAYDQNRCFTEYSKLYQAVWDR